MNPLKIIRDRLNLTQAAMAEGIGCSQGNWGHYENKGQTIPPAAAKKLIDFAGGKGLVITFDHIYGDAKLPDPPVVSAAEGQGA